VSGPTCLRCGAELAHSYSTDVVAAAHHRQQIGDCLIRRAARVGAAHPGQCNRKHAAERRAARQLLGALLRNPHELVNYVNRINPARVANLGEYAKTIGEVLNQFQTTGTYNMFVVERKSGVSGLRQVMQEDTDIFLGDAVEVFTQEYEFWASEAAHLYAVTQGQVFADAQKARDAFAEMSDLLKLDVDAKQTDWRTEAEQWAHNKLSGIEPVYPCINAVPGYCDVVPFFEPCLYYIIGARPGMGKTSFAVHLARKAAQQNYHCLFFSLEMSDTQIGDKIILSQTSVDPDRYKNGSLYDCEILEVNSVSNDLKKLQIEIDDKASSTIQYIESVATVKKKLGLCDAIYVDYIGLIGNESNLKVREQYIADVSRRLKALSKQLDIPVFILAQLNRDVEKRGDKMPQLSDLRESGAIEQDADIVIFIMRPEKYNLTFNDLSDYNLDSYVSDLKGLTIFNIEKNREGGTGIVLARNNEAMNTFTDINY